MFSFLNYLQLWKWAWLTIQFGKNAYTCLQSRECEWVHFLAREMLLSPEANSLFCVSLLLSTATVDRLARCMRWKSLNISKIIQVQILVDEAVCKFFGGKESRSQFILSEVPKSNTSKRIRLANYKIWLEQRFFFVSQISSAACHAKHTEIYIKIYSSRGVNSNKAKLKDIFTSRFTGNTFCSRKLLHLEAN